MNSYKNNKYAFIFQGAGTEFRKYLNDLEPDHLDYIHGYSHIVKKKTGIDLWTFITEGNPKNHEFFLVDQLAIYTINCSIYNLYHSMGMQPYILIGYSMGLYSALFAGEAVSFEVGIDLIINAYSFTKQSMGSKYGAMASIIGLSIDDLKDVIEKSGCEEFVEISNQNYEYSFLISGIEDKVEIVLKKAEEEGALKVLRIKANFPFHSRFVEDGAFKFLQYLEKQCINNLRVPLITCTNQNIIRYKSDIKYELYSNLKDNISWLNAVNKADALGVNKFIEMGLGEPLSKLSRLISKKNEFLGYEKMMILIKSVEEMLA